MLYVRLAPEIEVECPSIKAAEQLCSQYIQQNQVRENEWEGGAVILVSGERKVQLAQVNYDGAVYGMMGRII